MITFQVEPWEQYFQDPRRESLWQEHYDEFLPAHERKLEMAPDVSFYQAGAAAGSLDVVVARSAGEMIGYCLMFTRPHIHYCHDLCTFEDSYYLTRNLRRNLAGIGLKLVQTSIQVARRRGSRRLYFMTKEFISIARLLEHLGFAKMDSVYCLWLET